MDIQSEFLPQLCDPLALTPPPAANDNIKVKSDWMTPPEALQVIKNLKRKLARENNESHILLSSPERRRIWDEILACERCLMWKYFRNS